MTSVGVSWISPAPVMALLVVGGIAVQVYLAGLAVFGLPARLGPAQHVRRLGRASGSRACRAGVVWIVRQGLPSSSKPIGAALPAAGRTCRRRNGYGQRVDISAASGQYPGHVAHRTRGAAGDKACASLRLLQRQDEATSRFQYRRARIRSEIRPKKMGREIALGPNRYEGQKTSRGEQLMRRHWEEKAAITASAAVDMVLN